MRKSVILFLRWRDRTFTTVSTGRNKVEIIEGGGGG